MGKLSERYGLTDEQIEKAGSLGDFMDPPNNSWALLDCTGAGAIVSKAGNLCITTEYKVSAWSEKALTAGNLGTPLVWNNGGLMAQPKAVDLTGQPEEAKTKLAQQAGRFIHSIKAHGVDPEPYDDDTLSVEAAQLLAHANFQGCKVLARLKVLPAGGTYEAHGETRTRQRTRLDVAQVEKASPENMAKRGIVEAESETPF